MFRTTFSHLRGISRRVAQKLTTPQTVVTGYTITKITRLSVTGLNISGFSINFNINRELGAEEENKWVSQVEDKPLLLENVPENILSEKICCAAIGAVLGGGKDECDKVVKNIPDHLKTEKVFLRDGICAI